MNVIINIEGREAIPVRAIPLLTDWQTVTPDFLAQTLSGDEHFFCFAAMQAYRFATGDAIRERWWTENAVRPLKALSDKIRAAEISHETGQREFHTKSLRELPAGVYVWRDEFERGHQRHFGRKSLNQVFDAESAKLMAKHQELIALDYAPFINDELRTLVMDGFPSGTELPREPASTQSTATPAPVVQAIETKEQRQDRRLKACESDGMSFDDYKGRLPDGVGDVAEREGVTRQAFSTDVKAALLRRASAKREGVTLHRA